MIKIKKEKEVRGIIEYLLVNKTNKKMKKDENKDIKRKIRLILKYQLVSEREEEIKEDDRKRLVSEIEMNIDKNNNK